LVHLLSSHHNNSLLTQLQLYQLVRSVTIDIRLR